MCGEGETPTEFTLECLPGPPSLPHSLRHQSFLSAPPPSMTQLCLRRPKALAHPTPVPPRGLGAREGSWRPAGPCMSSGGPNLAQLLDSALGLGALGLTIRAVFSTPGPALLLLLLLVSFLAFDLLHW